MSAHASFYALYSGVMGDDASSPAAAVVITAIASTLRARIIAEGDAGVPCGSYPVQFLLQALYADGSDHGNAAFGVLTSTSQHSWRNMMASFGATATMECWLPSELENLSFSHVWSSSPAILIPTRFFGLSPTTPGYATFDVKPQPGPVATGEATLPTIKGPVQVAFTQTTPGRAGGCFTLSLTSPGGTVARALLPLWGDANAVVTLDGVKSAWVAVGDYAAVGGLEPGDHTLTTC